MPRDDYEEFSEKDLPEEEEQEEEDEFDEDDDAVEDEKDWEDEVETDEDVADLFNEAQNLDYGKGDLTRKLRSHTDKSPTLSGGDIDADWEDADAGEETVGGQNPTPDQSDVDDLGEAVGVVYDDNEPLDTGDKIEKRDKNPWELNPASAGPEFAARAEREFEQPLHSAAGNVQRKRTSPNAAAGASARAAGGGETATPTGRKARNTETSRRGGTSERVTTGGGHAAKSKRGGTSSRPAQTTATHRPAGARRANKTTRTGGHRAGKRS
jgi:hypothetical protein